MVISIGELLAASPPRGVRNVHWKMCWGDGLGSIYTGMWEAIDEITSHRADHEIPLPPILVMVGWAGNDVYGDHGYTGCSWIHQSKYSRSPADRKGAAEFVDKQYRRVQNAMEDLIKLLRHTQTHDIVVLGCGDANVYGLHPSYLSLASASI